jgi:hypothetical protein
VLGRVVAVGIPGRRRGEERVVALEADVLSLFYRCGYAVYSMLRPILPTASPGAPPGLIGRALRRSLTFAERILSLFLPARR